jgi:hypothetical protein
MNALARWKILLALIATFAAGAITGGFLTGRVTKDAARRAEQPRQSAPLTVNQLQRQLRLKPEQADKIASILTQMENELSNLRSLDVRESDGIFARGKGPNGSHRCTGSAVAIAGNSRRAQAPF